VITAARRTLAVFVAAHGVAHVLAFAVAWKLSHPKNMAWTSEIFGGRIDLGGVGIRLLGLLWLVAAAAYLVAVFRLWAGHGGAALTLTAATVVSALLCLTQPGRAKVGLVIDGVLLALLLARTLVVRRSAVTPVPAA
jgi:hypothetical protein